MWKGVAKRTKDPAADADAVRRCLTARSIVKDTHKSVTCTQKFS